MSKGAPSEHGPRMSSSALGVRLVAGLVLINLFVVALAGLSVHQSYLQFQERAEITTRNLAQALENDLYGTIKADDVALFDIMDEYQGLLRGGGKNHGATFNAYIERVRARLPEIDALRITDARGILIYGSGVTAGTNISLADRPHFIRLRDNPGAGLVFSRPQISRVNHKGVIVLARRIALADGSFGGMVHAAISQANFTRLFTNLDVGQHGTITLRDSEMNIVARHPETGGSANAAMERKVPEALLKLLRSGAQSGTYRAVSKKDGIDRTYSFRRVDGTPLLVTVGLARNDYLVEWRKLAFRLAELVVLFALITLAAAWLFYRNWKRHVIAVDALSTQEAKLRTVADFTYDWEYWQGPGMEILYMTPSCERVTGHSQAEFVADPGLLLRIVHPDDIHLMERHLHDLSYHEGALVNFRIVRRDGEIRWIAHHCRAVIGQDGTPMGRRISNRDVTEHKQMEDALRDSEERWKFALEGSGDGVWDWNIQSGAALYSRRWKEMLGYGEDEIGNSADEWTQRVHPADFPGVMANIESHLAGKTPTAVVEFRMLNKDGCWIWILGRGMVAERDAEGKPLRLVGTNSDISARKQAEEATLRESQKYQTLLRTAGDGIHVLDLDGNVLQVNDAFCRMLGYTPEEMANMNVAQWDAQWSTAELKSRIGELTNRNLTFETRHRRSDGSVIAVEINASGVEIGGQHMLYCSARDITERSRAEAALREKTEALLHSNADLEQFAYSISHDMRQPLRMVTGHLQLLERGLKDKLDPDDRENLAFALDGARRMDAMIVSLLDYSRIGRKTASKQWMESRASFDEALAFLAPAIEENGASIEVAGEWPRIFASRDELTRLFQNLVGNAVKYHPPEQAPRIEVSSDITPQLWRICVRDHGIGIVPKQIDRLFQFFSRLQSRAHFDGTGMGLALCRRIVEHHGGRIWAESAGEQQGSSFIFELPLNPADATAGDQEPPPGDPHENR